MAAKSQQKLSSSKFSEYVLSLEDLYNVAKRNGYFLPKLKSSAVNENMLFNMLQGTYWCPKSDDIRIKNCVKAPLKETLYTKIEKIAKARDLNIAWIDDKHMPDKDWMVAVIATLDPDDEIFKKDYVPPPIRKRASDIETIILPNELFENLPKSTSKVKARRLKIASEAFAAEKAARLKETQKEIFAQIAEHEERVEDYQKKKRPKTMAELKNNMEEEKKGETLQANKN